MITKFQTILQVGVDDAFLGGDLSDTLVVHKSKKQISFFPFFTFLFTFNCYAASLKFILQLICSSIMETQRVRQPFMKVISGKMQSFFCQFYYRLINTVRFNEERSYCVGVLILLLIFLGKIPKHHFLKVGRNNIFFPLGNKSY